MCLDGVILRGDLAVIGRTRTFCFDVEEGALPRSRIGGATEGSAARLLVAYGMKWGQIESFLLFIRLLLLLFWYFIEHADIMMANWFIAARCAHRHAMHAVQGRAEQSLK